ncbi:TetR/AcrR family transcriptional regulator [Actinosynnema mirum]|uniref:Transcriptional regulator, TetR family n=1 Tax=Actinosynnema mirum (strain ATCC 29888 / DSM 43827 / JCM 3225 / NBRC 14064 / NCIMB 13271 / NRRL B-12336 / IMRU 3971 / 101) TaxID=446462 RepID=C6WQU1_ACTMD|nr:TetR/AcrR family transcriptional regulator [Actinosynnema mirum]ACU38781.1 transcriptional regulator, TetR family [Actinosynnema mirum DSM 43827]
MRETSTGPGTGTGLEAITRLGAGTPDALRPVLEPLPELTPAGVRLLDAASGLFQDRGVRAVGVDLIAETAGTTKKTLYDRFGSKDALVALYLLHRAHRWREHVLAALGGGSARARVLRVFDALETWVGERSRGCAFVGAYAEIGDGDHPAVPVVRAEKAWMRALFVALAGDPGLGAHLHLVYEGTLVALTAGGDPEAVAEGRRAVRLAMGASRGAGSA